LLKNFLVCKGGAESSKKAAGEAATTQNAPYHTKYPKFLQHNVNFKRFEIHMPT